MFISGKIAILCLKQFKRYFASLEERLISELVHRKYTMNLEHLLIPESKGMLKRREVCNNMEANPMNLLLVKTI
jgi:hypothetical protein